MSHLSTIISRVKHRLSIYNNNEIEASKDPLFLQAVRNLMEYNYPDFTPDERKEADLLYSKYAKWLRVK